MKIASTALLPLFPQSSAFEEAVSGKNVKAAAADGRRGRQGELDDVCVCVCACRCVVACARHVYPWSCKDKLHGGEG